MTENLYCPFKGTCKIYEENLIKNPEDNLTFSINVNANDFHTCYALEKFKENNHNKKLGCALVKLLNK